LRRFSRSSSLLGCLLLAIHLGAGADDNVRTLTTTLADDAAWIAEVPEKWNGTLLLYSRGYAFKLGPPQSAGRGTREQLLENGYALTASAYPEAGWSVETAVPSQLLALEEFIREVGEPNQTIAWGSSMGGLITSALAERHGHRFDGALPMCASSMGALPMLNMAFDGAYVLTTLLPSDPPLAITGVGDNTERTAAFVEQVEQQFAAPAVQARVALAGVLGGLPGWTVADNRPPANDYAAQAHEMLALLRMGLFLPRGDQEHRAGGVFSSNTDIDYRQLLDDSGRREIVDALYERAGLNLEQDLERLNMAPRTAADAKAVDYMAANYTTTGKTTIPVLSIHTIGDGMTSPALQASYVKKVKAISGETMAAALWIDRAGHCTQSADEVLLAIRTLQERLAHGQWQTDIEHLNKLSDSHDVRFTDYDSWLVPREAKRWK